MILEGHCGETCASATGIMQFDLSARAQIESMDVSRGIQLGMST